MFALRKRMFAKDPGGPGEAGIVVPLVSIDADIDIRPRKEGQHTGEQPPMTYVIAEPCIGTKDKSCVDVCPVDCIHGADEDPQLYINPEECIDCGACEPACPVTAIFVDYDVPEQWKGYTELNADYFKTGRTTL
jgi:ferredoxin